LVAEVETRVKMWRTALVLFAKSLVYAFDPTGNAKLATAPSNVPEIQTFF